MPSVTRTLPISLVFASVLVGQPHGQDNEQSAWTFSLLDNGDFRDVPPTFADEDGVYRIPWWETARGIEQLRTEGEERALVTEGDDWARQPVAAYAPLAGGLIVRGEVAGTGLVSWIDGGGRRFSARVESSGDPFEPFELGWDAFAAAPGRSAPRPRFSLELASAAGAALWRDIDVLVPLPTPTEKELRAEILDELRWIFALWLDHALDDAGPEETGFLGFTFDVVTGERLSAIDAGPNVFFELLLDALEVHEEETWRAALDRFIADFLVRGLHPKTGLPRKWDVVQDRPKDMQFVELLVFDALPHRACDPRTGEMALFRARRGDESGETLLRRAVLPGGAVAAKLRPADAAVSLRISPLRRLNLVAELGRLGAILEDERYTSVARDAVAALEYTHYWPGWWDVIDPGFDDVYGNYGARAVDLWRVDPGDPMFRRLALRGFARYAPLWNDALRLGGSIAADQVRCWRLLTEVAELEPTARPDIARLLAMAARSHFKGEQYGDGSWGDVTIFGFDPQDHLQVGDLTGTPQNLLYGLASLYDEALWSEPNGPDRTEVRAMFTAVMRSSKATYRRPFGYLATRVENSGTNMSQGSLRLAVGLVEMLRRLD